MMRDLRIYYRGPLAGCNYDCDYCPFAKTRDDRQALEADARALRRFVDWVKGHTESRLSILFTPWGEAMVHAHYRDALIALSHVPQVERVAIQTNLSASTPWLADAHRDHIALWCTYHPSQVARARFLERCAELDALEVRYSVGMVGLASDIDEIEATRRALPAHVYLWVNAYKHAPYTADEVARLTRVDPLFALNNRRHASRGLPCNAGHRAVSVDGEGVVRRCHFVREPIGHLYQGAALSTYPEPRACPNETCGCYIGYTNLPALDLDALYGQGLLERIPPPHQLDVAAAERALTSFHQAQSER